MTASDDGTAGRSPNRIAAVPCQDAGLLALLDVGTGERLGTIPVGSHPVHATSAAGTTFVATMGERAVTAVRPDGEVEQVDTGVLGPSHFAAVRDELFVTCTAGDVVAVIDPDGPALVDRIAVGAEPHELVVDPVRETVLVGTRRNGTVDVVAPRDRAVLASVDVGSDARVQGIALASDGDRGYAVDQSGSRVVAFDPHVDGDASPSAVAAVGSDPYDLVATGDRVLVPGREDGTVHEFDSQLGVNAVHDGFGRPVDLFRLDGSWWVLDASDPAIRSLDGRAVDAGDPGLSATPVDGRLLVSHYDDDRVSLVDLETGPVWTQAVPARPFGAVVV